MRSQEECFVNYTIKVPSDAIGGSQNVSIIVASVPEYNEDGNSIGLNAQYRFAYNLFTDINAEGAYYEGKILKNNIPKILFSPPLRVDSLVKNTGTLDFKTEYNVVMKKYFGGDEVFNESWDTTIFSDSELSQTKEWESAPEFGLFLVTQEINLLDETSSKTQLVLLFPLWLLLIFLGVIILLLWALYTKIKGRKNNKK